MKPLNLLKLSGGQRRSIRPILAFEGSTHATTGPLSPSRRGSRLMQIGHSKAFSSESVISVSNMAMAGRRGTGESSATFATVGENIAELEDISRFGRPHFGHAGARSECSKPQSGQVISPMVVFTQ